MVQNDVISVTSFASLSTDSTKEGMESNSTRSSVDSMFPDLNTESEESNTISFGIISDDVIRYIYTINFSVICTVCCLFGLVTNVINIIIFYRQGFQETVNIALMGLSISDLFSLLSLLWVTICYNPLFMYSDVPILTIEVQHKTGGWTHVIFTRVTAFVTVYITLERCLCIAFPLKIKSLLTPKRVAAIIVIIYVVIIGSMSQNYSNFRLVWKFVPHLNKTMFGMIYTENRYTIQTITYYLNVLYLLASLTGVVTCSGIMIWKLNQRSKWLTTATSTSAQDTSRSARDRQVVKLIVCVAGIFICSFTPSVIFFLAIAIKQDLNVGKRYENLFITLYSITYTLEALNSSVNIFVYYNMSSKYKAHFKSLFSCGGNNKS